MSENILEINNLSKYFGGLAAVSDCSIKVKRGTITGIIGPNGSGKTTLFNLIAGNLKSSGGSVTFDDENITHVEGKIDPLNDIELIETELLLADLETLEKSEKRLFKLAKNNKNAKFEHDIVLRLKKHCEDGNLAKEFNSNSAESQFIKSLFLLTNKPFLYVANVDENTLLNKDQNLYLNKLIEYVTKKSGRYIKLCGKIEQEISCWSNP